MTFFEIDPVVIEVASDPRFFTYLVRRARRRRRSCEGDARLSLAVEPDGPLRPPGPRRVLQRLDPRPPADRRGDRGRGPHAQPDGVIAFHISNRYYDLSPAIAAAARPARARRPRALARSRARPANRARSRAAGWPPRAIRRRLAACARRAGRTSTPADHPFTDDYADLSRTSRRVLIRRLPPQPNRRSGASILVVTSLTLDAEPACPAADRDPDRPAPGPSRLRVERRSIADIPQATWDALAARNPWATPFSGWAFQRAWWDAYGDNAHEETLVVVPADAARRRDPIAIVPLMHRHEVEPDDAPDSTRRCATARRSTLTPVPPTATAVFFGASYHADYATILAAPADLPAVADALADYLADPADRRPWDVVDLRRLRCGDPAADALAAAFGAREMAEGWTLNVEREDVCPVVTLPGRRRHGRPTSRRSARRSATRSGARSAGPRPSARSASTTRPTRSPTSRRSSSSTRSAGAPTASSRTRRAAPRAASSSGACSSSTAPTARCA